MAGSPETIFERRVPHDLDRFHVQARPSCGMAPDDLRRRNVDNRARFKIRMQPCRRVIFDDRTSGSVGKSTGLIQGRFGGAGHCSISLPATMPVQPQTLLVGTIKTRSVPSHAELKPDPHDCLKRACSPATSDEPAQDRHARIAARPRRDATENWRKIGANRSKKGKVILKVVTTNICGSDQHMVRGRTTAPAGMVLGHEITGEVIEKGRDVEYLQI